MTYGGQGLQVGDHNVQHNHFYGGFRDGASDRPAGPAAAGPVAVGNVPQEPAGFQPRAELMAALEPRPEGRGSPVSALTGIRGAGKTQAAAAYARRRLADQWRLVAWVDASAEESLLAGLEEVADAAGIGEADAEARERAASVRHWLETDGEQRLLVLDNAGDLDALRPFLPAAGAAQVIVTSSRQSAAGLGAPVRVGVFSEGEALAYLAARTGLDDEAGARELAGELGCLPLGLAQAAALIARQHLDYQKYLDRLRSRPVADYLKRSEGDEYPYRLAEAIELSLGEVEESDPSGLSGELLALVSVLAESGVGREFLSRIVGDEEETDETLGILADASLLGFSVDRGSVTAHRLVMRVIRERLAAAGGLPETVDTAVQALMVAVGAIDETWRDPVAVRDLAGQASAVTECLTTYPEVFAGEIPEALLWVRMRSLGMLNGLQDTTGLAISVAEPLADDCERVLGADHPGTLIVRQGLAMAYWVAGRLTEAVPLLEQVRADRERLLGVDHPETQVSRNNLAVLYRDAGRLAEAIELTERVLADTERLHGSGAVETLTPRNNLATAYQSVGRTAEAIALHEQVLADRERLLGADHADTLTSRNNLALAYQDAERQEDAIPLLEQVLAARERLLGTGHLDTLASRSNLAVAYAATGREEEAVVLHEQVLADRESLLGADHPGTLASRSNLATAYMSVGRTADAIVLHEQVLADWERLLGADHPDTLFSRSNLAVSYLDAERTAEAIPLLEQVLADRERLFDADYHGTLMSREILAVAYQRAGRTADAIPLLERVRADRERLFGADDLATLASANNLAVAYRHEGRAAEAVALFTQNLADCERALGADHPNTRAARSNLDSTRQELSSRTKNQSGQRTRFQFRRR